MNRVLVLYKSKYGSTERYAKWMKEAFPCDVYEIDHYHFDNSATYDYVVAAGGIYASGIAGIKTLKKNLHWLKNKKLILFAVGASPFDEAAIKELKAHNLDKVPEDTPLFYARGTYNESKMNFRDRTLCRMLKKSLSKKDPSTYEPWMSALLEAGDGSCDWTEPAALNPLTDYIRQHII